MSQLNDAERAAVERFLQQFRAAANLPPPMSIPECDLRGLEWMPLQTADLLDSTLFLESTGDEFKAAVALICASWRQVPAGSLPSSDRSLAILARTDNWTAVRTMALRNWVLCSDGRYYHPIVAAKAMEALPHRLEFVEKKTAEAERKDRERKDRKELFRRLREEFELVLPASTKTTELREKVAELERKRYGDTPPVTVKTPESVTPVTPNNRDMSRLGQGHHTTPQGQDSSSSCPIGTTRSPASADDDAPPESGGQPFELLPEDPDARDSVTPARELPSCPHRKVLDLWREVLPELPQHDPDEWGGQRADNLRARWREKAAKLKWANEEAGLTYFRRLFLWIRKSPWLMGQVTPQAGRRLFQLELQWLVRPNNWPNVLEGKYHEAKE